MTSYYWGFRQTRLGKSRADSVLNPGAAVLNGPYSTCEEAEKWRSKEIGNWDAAVSEVFLAATREEAKMQIESKTPRS